MKGMHIANKLASAVDKYHSKKGPKGPEHAEEKPALEAHDEHLADAGGDPHGIEALEGQICPGCHVKVREHLVAKAKDSKIE